MRRFKLILISAILFSCSSEMNDSTPEYERIMTYEAMKKQFHNPTPEYRTAPFWVWNNDVSKEDIDRSLTEYRDKGFGGVFLHPRYGLITEYLSDEWWELVDYSLQKAEELDLKLWIYDENSFPSGFAGGHVAAQMPEANNEGVALKPYFMDRLKIPEEVERPEHIFIKEGDVWTEITAHKEEFMNSKGDFCVLDLNDYETSKWFGGYSYVDLLKPGVTEKFIEITMPGYEKTLGREFGKRVPGVFTDEPNTNTRRAGPIRYTPDLYEVFEKYWGYRLEPHLMSLITETGDWKRIRHNYQSTILQLFIDRWSKPWFRYTEEKNLQWTGHYWEHGWPSPKEGPDNMAMYAWHQTPAIDMLFNAEEARPDQFGNIRNVKELSSVANQFDRHRTLSETYGAAGWELTFDDMKRLGDWEYVLGVNFMNQHLSYLSLAGDRKHDFPQSFGQHAPYWGVYRTQADYFARLSLALSSGHQVNDILVIEPTTTAWMYYNPNSRLNTEMEKVKKEFEYFLEKLEKYQVEYDLGCENIIKDHGKIEGNRFVVNKASYDKVILPPGTHNLDSRTFELLTQFVRSGGEVMQLDNAMKYINGEEQDLNTFQNESNWRIIPDPENVLFHELAVNENIEFENIETAKGEIFHQRREFEDGQLFFITNFHKEETAELALNMAGKSIIDMNAHDGHIKPYTFDRKKGRVHFTVKLPPSGSQLLFISYKRGKSIEQESFKESKMESGDLVISRITPNILNLDYVQLTVGKFKKAPFYFYDAANEIWKAHGFPDNPWVSSSQFKTELVDRESFPPGTGFEVSYPFYAAADFNETSIHLVVERPWLYTVEVNGEIVRSLKDRSWMDPDFHILEIGSLVKPGKNEVKLTASPFSIFCELEPVYLLGDFVLSPEETGFQLQNGKQIGLGSWADQGLPFYGQTISYKKTVKVALEGDFLIRLPKWKGTVAEILVDGVHKGIVQSKPYDLKISLPYGEHEISVNVIGSNKNTFGPHHNFTTPGIVTPWSFKRAPEEQPAGVDYDLLDYGLMEEFEVYRLDIEKR